MVEYTVESFLTGAFVALAVDIESYEIALNSTSERVRLVARIATSLGARSGTDRKSVRTRFRNSDEQDSHCEVLLVIS